MVDKRKAHANSFIKSSIKASTLSYRFTLNFSIGNRSELKSFEIPEILKVVVKIFP